jgi:hypothetical protein
VRTTSFSPRSVVMNCGFTVVSPQR